MSALRNLLNAQSHQPGCGGETSVPPLGDVSITIARIRIPISYPESTSRIKEREVGPLVAQCDDGCFANRCGGFAARRRPFYRQIRRQVKY